MEISKILTADILDILFEGKNKEYGAYELRKSYAGRMRLAITVTTSAVLLCVAGFLFAGKSEMISTTILEIPDTNLTDIPDKPVDPPLIPPPPVKPPEVLEKRVTQIVVVQDHLVPPDEEVPLNEDLEKAKISLINKDGADFGDIISPPVQQSISNGIIEPPKRDNADSVFMTVSIESSYPGGTEAWRRFLIKSLSNNYPQEAADQGIQGKVMVMFIVDKDGNVSNVHAIDGPKELHEIAVKVIKKSGKWQPAQQNGRIVNSYKRQPIVFTISEP